MNQPTVIPSTSSRPRVAVWAALLVFTLARAVAAFLPSMWLWGIDAQRFLSFLAAWLPWVACAIALRQSVGVRLSRALEAAGTRLTTGVPGAALAGFAGAALVWLLPDRTWVTGDFMLRQGWAESESLAGTFAQSLPLEILLDRTLPRIAPAADPGLAARVIGALAAGALAIVALRIVRAWGLTGVAAAIGAAVIFFGGYLAAFTGLGKPAAVMCVLTALVLLGATGIARSGAGALLGSSLALALLTHRGALLLLPLWIVAIVLALRGAGERAPVRRRALVAAIAPPVIALAVVVPMIARIVREVDLPGHLASPAVRHAGILASAFDALHLVDLANLVLFYSLAPVIALVLVLAVGLRHARGSEAKLLASLVTPFIPAMLFIHPMQGIVRDLDVFATAGLSLALASAFAIGRALERAILPAWLGAAILLSVAVPGVQWLIHFHDPVRGLERVRAFALEDPVRPDDERARLWDALAYRAFRLRQWDQAVEACEQSARYAPHERPLMMLAIARTYAGAHALAEAVYVDLARRYPEDPLVWIGLGGAALRTGDSLAFRRALEKLNTYAPGSPPARIIRRHLTMFPEVWPTGAELGQGTRPTPP